MDDLELCGFIQSYSPFNLNDSAKRKRYSIADSYLQFYYKFIKPIKKRIMTGDYNNGPTKALQSDTYYKWLGFAFERMCRKYQYVIAKILGFSAVYYTAGTYFSKKTDLHDPGYQIDLLFDRKDLVYTICEIKYQRSKVSMAVVDEFEKKLQLFPNPKNYTIHKVLIASAGAEDSVINASYFDNIITLEDFFEEINWV